MATINPKASEITVSFKFFGPDLGAFPATSANQAITTRKLNRLKFEAGDEVADFKAGQQTTALNRLIGSSPRVFGSMNLDHPDTFLLKFKNEGPLVEMIITTYNLTLSGAAQQETFTFRGLMRGPEVDFLTNPGSVVFEVVSYGFVLGFTGSSEQS